MTRGYRRLFDLRLGGRARVAAEMDLEIEAHLAMRTADLVRAGMPPDDARREAERRFGDFAEARRRLHEGARQRDAAVRARDRFGSIIADVRYAIRQAKRAPGFTTLAIATLALGLGATTTIFTIVDRVLLRPLPFPHAERLVQLTGRDSSQNVIDAVSSADWLDWRTAPALQNSALYSVPFRQGIVTTDSAMRVNAVNVSGGFFAVLQARFIAGRAFTDAEAATSASPTAVISERLWRRVYNADPRLVAPLRTPTRSYTIIGVVADGQELPANTDVWMPTVLRPAAGQARTWLNWHAIARIAPDASYGTAITQLGTISANIRAADPAAIYAHGVGVQSLGTSIVGDAGSYLQMLMGAVLVVLLIVCANVAAAGLARAAVRSREMAVRTSLGAPRWRLIQQLLIEHVWLGAAGGVLGLFVAWAATRGIVAAWGAQIPRANEIAIDTGVFAFAVAISLLAGALAGIFPAIRVSRVSLASMMSSGSRTAARGGRNIAGASLVSLEIALAVMLLSGAGLLIRSFRAVISRDLGFETNVATVEAILGGPRYGRDTVRRYIYWDGLLEAVRRVPGVQAAGLSQWIPLGMTGQGFIDVAGRDFPGAGAVYRTVSQDFFHALRMPLLVGRTFDGTDGSGTGRVVVINKTMAEKYWPGESPLGKQVRARSMEFLEAIGGTPAWLTVIGVVGDVRTYGLETEARPEMYVYFRQTPTWTTGMTVLVRANRPAAELLSDLRRAARSVDANVAVDVGTLGNLLRSTLATRTLSLSLMTAFAGVALVLAALGIYGVLSYAVAQRTRELAVRTALGAQRGELLRLVMVSGLKVVLVGVFFGGVAARLLTQLLESMLVDVSPVDPLSFGLAIVLLVVVCIGAIFVPSLRATRLDPNIALQAE